MTGGVGLPEVTLHELATGEARPCTRDVTLGLSDLLPWRELTTFTAQSLLTPRQSHRPRAFWSESRGSYALYQNPHNDYLVSFPAPPGRGKEVVVMRFKPPTVPQTRAGRTAFTGSEQVRYWSMCIGGVSTQTSACIPDFEAKLDAAGYVTLVVSDAPDVRRHAMEHEPPVLGQGTRSRS